MALADQISAIEPYNRMNASSKRQDPDQCEINIYGRRTF
ncbi:unnamed protein product [Acidithrix sp. C25]|nr:unnamed protein product [Acidithrix sp. C25]